MIMKGMSMSMSDTNKDNTMDNVHPVPVRPLISMPYIGLDGNIFMIMGKARRVLRAAGYSDEASFMTIHVNESKSYAEALGIIMRYVAPDEFEHTEDSDD